MKSRHITLRTGGLISRLCAKPTWDEGEKRGIAEN